MNASRSAAQDDPTPQSRLQVGEPRSVVWLWGEHDLATTAEINSVIEEAIAANDHDVVIDLGDITFMDASTTGALLRGHSRLAQVARGLVVRAPTRPARRVLEVSGVADLIEEAEPSIDTHEPLRNPRV